MPRSITDWDCFANEVSSAAKDAYKEKWIHDLVQQISQYLKDNVDWIVPKDPKQVRILDYACGGGIVSKVCYDTTL